MHLTLTLCNTPIRTDDGGRVSLNDIHAAAQNVDASDILKTKRDPRRWQKESGEQFVEFVAESLNVRKSDILKTKRGKGGGTFAHWQIALAYAKYLSPALHMQVNEVYIRFKSGDITLADEIADRATPEQQEWLVKRTTGKIARNQLTSTLAAHGVHGKGYADCTNAIYKPILGGKKSEICAARGLPRSTNLRDVMDVEQLTRTALAEIVAKKRITRYDVRGNAPCTSECSRAAEAVASIQ